MKRKSIALLLALVMCLGLAVPAFAAETLTYTYEGITVTASPNGTVSFTGSGVLTDAHMEAGLGLFMMATNGQIKTLNINIGANVTYDKKWLEDMNRWGSQNGWNVVISDPSAPVLQTVGGFTDVKPGDYFADPVLWAVIKRITAGTSATTFSPDNICTRGQIATFLYRGLAK